jgi:parvulin-like peptidyl-prolyl isomerase
MGVKVFAAACGLTAAAVVAEATVVMQVNGVGVSDYALNRARRAAAAASRDGAADPAAVTRRAVEQVVGHVLLVQAAREAGVTVGDDEVERRITSLRSRYPSAEAFAAALQQGGTTEAEVRTLEAEDLLIQRFTEKVLGPRAAVSPEEVAAYYRDHPTEFDHPEQVKVEMILAAVAKDATPEAVRLAEAKIGQAAKRLATGEPFAAVARDLSDDPTRARGGEVGWVRAGQLLPELDAEVFKLQAGEVTAPIRTVYGFHIMGAIERRPAGRSPFAEVESTLADMLKANKVRTMLAALVSERRAKATIETLDPAIKAALGAAR